MPETPMPRSAAAHRPVFEVLDSRRLTGPNLLWSHPGAVLDVGLQPFDDATCELAINAWRRRCQELLDLLHWEEPLTSRVHPGGFSVALSAPMDALYAATEINELAWQLAHVDLQNGAPRQEPSEDQIQALRRAIADEANPAQNILEHNAAERAVRFVCDDDEVSLGAGCGSRCWPARDLPTVDEVPWSELHDVPTALVTGTNGKTTTIRLLAAMCRATGRVTGMSSTDGVWVDDRLVDDGDYSGPGGARLVLRQTEVEVALLETARGGLLRRGLGVQSADVALITNIAEDHLGEFGVADLDGLTRVKGVVARAARLLVLNADDPQLVDFAARLAEEVDGEPPELAWFSLQQPVHELLERGVLAAGLRVRDDVEWLTVCGRDEDTEDLIPVAEAPLTLGGAARHNVANVLAALLVARGLGLEQEPVHQALKTFGARVVDNVGRLNAFRYGDPPATVLLDFAHNPHGLQATLETARALRPNRLIVAIGQAGDRDDRAIDGLAETAAEVDPDLVILKELPDYLRGREPGEVTGRMRRRLLAAGMRDDQIAHVDGEGAAVDRTMQALGPGDVAVLTVHAQREKSLARLGQLRASDWRPGKPLTPWPDFGDDESPDSASGADSESSS